MKIALLGLYESGKSTLFSAVSGDELTPPGSTHIEEAVVSVPDERVEWLADYYKPKKVTYATIDCLDLPGFNFTDEHGRAAARRLINKIRTVDLLVFVVRAFENPAAPSYKGRIDPVKDFEELETELLLSDLELVTTRIENLEKQIQKPTRTQTNDKQELDLYKKLQDAIENEKPVSSVINTEAEIETVKSLGFLTLKPVVVAVNIGENQIGETQDFKPGFKEGSDIISLSVELEYELAQLDEQSRKEFMADLGISEAARGKFVHSCYSALGLISFLTVVSDELRAWPIRQGTTALDAAGKIHTDIKRGFIRAETMSFEDLKSFGDEKAVKAAGKVRLEGKDYVVQDGDIINFRFNV